MHWFIFIISIAHVYPVLHGDTWKHKFAWVVGNLSSDLFVRGRYSTSLTN